MGIHRIKKALPLVAAAYGRKFGLRVLIGGDVAYTNGYDIVLPDADIYNSAYQQVAWGYLAHEAAHIRYTNFKDLVDPEKEAFRFTLLNILEDVRIERCIFREFPGTRYNVNAVIEYLAERRGFAANSDEPVAIHFQMWMLCHVRIKVLEQSVLIPQYEALTATLSHLLPSDLIKEVMLLLEGADRLMSTLDALHLADDIIACLQSIADSDDKHNMSARSDLSPSDFSKTSKKGANEQVKQTEPQDAVSQTASSERNANVNAQSSMSEGNEETQTHSPSLKEIIDEMLRTEMDDCLRDTFSDMADHLSLLASESRCDKTTTFFELPCSVPIPQVARRSEDYEVNGLQLSTAALRVKLKSLLMSYQLRKVKPARRGTKIAKRQLANSQVGHQKVFYQNHEVKSLNTYVHLLVDNSRSMRSENHYQTVNSAAFCLAHALEMFASIECEVTYFPGETSPVKQVLLHNQRASSQAPFFAQMCDGCTPLAESLFYVAERIALRNKPRNLVIVLTDGLPDDTEKALGVINFMTQAGVEIYGLGIGSDSVTSLFEHCAVITKQDPIEEALFNAVHFMLSRMYR